MYFQRNGFMQDVSDIYKIIAVFQNVMISFCSHVHKNTKNLVIFPKRNLFIFLLLKTEGNVQKCLGWWQVCDFISRERHLSHCILEKFLGIFSDGQKWNLNPVPCKITKK